MRRTEIIDTRTQESTLETCRAYIGARKSCFEFRAIRYEAVADMLFVLGLTNNDTVVDVGAGDGEFGVYLRGRGFTGQYTPVDGMLDGTNLNYWTPEPAEFFVSIEVIEHLEVPEKLLRILDNAASKGVVLTTPNPIVTDVKAMDATHISEVYPEDFLKAGYRVHPQIFFFEPEDSLLAWKDNR